MVQLGYGFSRYIGVNGYNRSNLATADQNGKPTTVSYFVFNTYDVYSSHGPDSRWLGFPVRCLASGA